MESLITFQWEQGVGAASTEDDLEQLYRSLRRDLHYNGDLVRTFQFVTHEFSDLL